MGTLYCGDNLDILKRYIKDESVDLVYLDPPFNSAQNYNALFQEKDPNAAGSSQRFFSGENRPVNPQNRSWGAFPGERELFGALN
jgi:DNA modification methylase